eukprot:2110775-Rhodomonas_salina.1
MPYVLKTGGKGLWARTVTENILSYSNLLHCCFKVKLEAGRPGREILSMVATLSRQTVTTSEITFGTY